MTTQTTPILMFGGADPRCEALLCAIMSTIYERGKGMPFPSILGTLRLVEISLLSEQNEAINA